MLRKTGYLTLATLLLIATVGFVVSRHYCADELVAISINSPADNCCEDQADDCCDNDNITFLLDVDYTQPDIFEWQIKELDVFWDERVDIFINPATTQLDDKLNIKTGYHPKSKPLLSTIQSFLL